LLPVLVAVPCRAPLAAAPRPPLRLLSDVRPARAGVPPRALQRLLPVLVSDRPRAAAPPSAPNASGAAALPPLWAVDGDAGAWPVPCLLRVRTTHRPGAPRAAVAALMDPPEGYAAITCPVCGRGYQTLRQAPVAYGS